MLGPASSDGNTAQVKVNKGRHSFIWRQLYEGTCMFCESIHIDDDL